MQSSFTATPDLAFAISAEFRSREERRRRRGDSAVQTSEQSDEEGKGKGSEGGLGRVASPGGRLQF